MMQTIMSVPLITKHPGWMCTILGILGVSLSISSMVLFIGIISSREFWASVEELEKAREDHLNEIAEFREAKREFLAKSLKLVDKILEFDKL